MRFVSKHSLAVGVAIAAGLLSGGAGVASAAPAVFSPAPTLALWSLAPASSLVITVGATPTPSTTLTCNNPSFFPSPLSNSGSPLQGHVDSLTAKAVTCSIGSGGSTVVDITPRGQLAAEKSGAAFSLTSPTGIDVRSSLSWLDTFANGTPVPMSVPWTNASGGTPSQITFSSTTVGKSSGFNQPVKFTGVLRVPSASGTLTLS